MISLKKIASYLDGHLIGDENVIIDGIASIKDAKEGDITFLIHPTYKKYLHDCKASAIIVGKNFPVDSSHKTNIIVVDHPVSAYTRTIQLFIKPRERKAGTSELASISKESKIAEDVSVAPYVFIDQKADIRSGVTIFPFVCIGADVIIDEGSTIYPHVTIYDNVTIGKNVTIHSGTVIGSDGFGYIWDGEKHAKVPQIGGVTIEDDVEIGANVTIDRAALGRTIIKKGTKIDNLVQIAHNVSIGEHSIIVSQVGISGSATIGSNVVLGGQAGVADHVSIGNNVMAGGRAGITGDVPPNSLISGTPHMPHKEWLRMSAYLKKLPLLFQKMKKIEKTLHLEDSND